jgi:hypothetical protein
MNFIIFLNDGSLCKRKVVRNTNNFTMIRTRTIWMKFWRINASRTWVVYECVWVLMCMQMCDLLFSQMFEYIVMWLSDCRRGLDW